MAWIGASSLSAAPLQASGTDAVISSVDGPGLLTVKVGRRTLPAHLAGLETAGVGECGAESTTGALRGFVARAPKPFSYALLERSKRQFERDASGRIFIHLAYRVRSRWRDLTSDLGRAGWARIGEPATLESRPVERGSIADGTPGGPSLDPFEPTRPATGMWTQCGGRFHLPADADVPPTAAVPWTVDEYGVTQAIGPLALSPTLSPTQTLTLRRLSELVPTEIGTWFFGTCLGHVPSLQIWAWAAPSAGQTCGEALVGQIRTAGPGAASIARGGKVGESVASLKRSFPKLDLASTPEWAWLSGDPERQWAWQTVAEYRDSEQTENVGGPITGFTTLQAPRGPDN